LSRSALPRAAPVGSKVASLLFGLIVFTRDAAHHGCVADRAPLPVPAGERPDGEGRRERAAAAPLAGIGGFQLVLRSPYLRLIALLFVVLNIVNTTGEYVVSKSVVAAAARRRPSIPTEHERLHRHLYGDYFPG
jgi:AAA family ATP:ADP antiporter